MCGRFVSASPPDEIARYFDAEAPEALLEPSFNVAPTNDVYAVLSDGGVRRVDAFHWGLVPGWAKDPKVGSRMINARAETLATKNAYKPALKRRRCLIPADGFYEWQKLEGTKRKQPYFIQPARRGALRLRGAVGGVARPQGRRGQAHRRPAAVGDDHHDHAERRDGQDPRPHAGDPAGVGLGRLARPR